MKRVKINLKYISEDIEGLSIASLKKAFQRYRRTTSTFRNLNVRDPLDYLDFEVNLHAELAAIEENIKRGNYFPKRPQVHFAPKKNGISRPTVTLAIEDAIVYRFCLEQMDAELIEVTRQKNIHGGVMASPVPEPEDGEYYEKWFDDWMEHNKAVHEALSTKSHIATTDISSYFDNVNLQSLIELLRRYVPEKPNLVDFLSFFVSNVKLRYGYSTTLDTGLVQDDTDCSRILAYFYLHTHDTRMIDHARKINADYFRYVDDMNIVVCSETDAKLSLKILTDSLRKLGLTASIEKTQINTSSDAIKLMKKTENEQLTTLDNKITYALNYNEDLDSLKEALEKCYKEMINDGCSIENSWIKLLRRFYTLASRLQLDFLMDDAEEHILRFPDLIATGKLQRYILVNMSSDKIPAVIDIIIEYLDSEENLYPQAETMLIELLASLDLEAIPAESKKKIIEWSEGRFDNEKSLLSDYAKGINALLLYKADKSNNERIAQVYLSNQDFSEYQRKCLALVSLTVNNETLLKKVKRKTRMNVNPSMKRLIGFVDGLPDYKNAKPIKNYLKNNLTTVYYGEFENEKGEDDKKRITVDSKLLRVEILNDLIAKYG